MELENPDLDAILTAEDLQKDPQTFVAELQRVEQILLLHRYLSFATWDDMDGYYRDVASGRIYRPGISNRPVAEDVLRTIRKFRAYESQKPAFLKDALDAYLLRLRNASRTTTTTN